MAVKMRLRREGKKKQPFYRVVVADARSPRDGRYIDDLGYYQPLHDPSTVHIDRERALYWLRNGVEPTNAVVNLLRIEGIWQEFRPQAAGGVRQRRGDVPDSVVEQAREEVTQPQPGPPEETGAIREEQSS